MCALSRRFSKVLQSDVKLIFSNNPSPKGICLHSSYSPERQKSWLRGRECLISLTKSESSLTFPHPELSLSHSSEWAVAVQCKNFNGVGVDLQLGGEFKHGIEKFFLREKSNELFEVDDLRKWWTVKEACYKANPLNKDTVLNDYKIDTLQTAYWESKSQGTKSKFIFHSERFEEGWLSVALNLGLC